MIISREKLLMGKATIIKGKEYLSTKDYVQPFFDYMSKFTNEYIIEVEEPKQVTLTNDGKEDTTYNRVNIQAIMPRQCDINGHKEVYGLVYALDIRNPVYKIYRGYLNKDNNLFVFDSRWLDVKELKPTEKFKFDIETLMKLENNFSIKLDVMNKNWLPVTKDSIYKNLGSYITKSMLYSHQSKFGSKVKLSPAMVVKAYENVYMDSSSKFYIKPTEESTIYNYYSAFAQIVQDEKKDILNRWEKTYLISSLFGLITK